MAAKAVNKPPADVPTDFGKHLRACMRCKLLKTFEQVRPARGSARVRRQAPPCAPCGPCRLRRAQQCRAAR